MSRSFIFSVYLNTNKKKQFFPIQVLWTAKINPCETTEIWPSAKINPRKKLWFWYSRKEVHAKINLVKVFLIHLAIVEGSLPGGFGVLAVSYRFNWQKTFKTTYLAMICTITTLATTIFFPNIFCKSLGVETMISRKLLVISSKQQFNHCNTRKSLKKPRYH